MSENCLFLDIVDQRLDEEESWLIAESKTAQLCMEFEEHLASINGIVRFVLDGDRLWRKAVFTGTIKNSPTFEARHKTVFEKFMELDKLVLEMLAHFAAQNYDGGVKGSETYLKLAQEARSVYENWTSPELSPAIGHHDVTLDRAQSENFRKLLASAR